MSHGLSEAAHHLGPAGVHGWLVRDHAGSNPVFARLLGDRFQGTRPAFLLITKEGSRLLVSRVDATPETRELPGCVVETYTSWEDLNAWLATQVGPLGVIAMEYSPRAELPAMSRVDGGTLDLVRDLGVEVRSSADLLQLAVGAWTEANLRSHRAAMAHVADVKDLAFDLIARRLRAGEACTEHAVQSFVLSEFQRRDLVTDHPPIVAVREHSGDPHYVPSEERSSDIRVGDWVLLDLWCKERGPDGVFADITWVGCAGPRPGSEQQEVFEIVAQARDAVVETLRRSAGERSPVLGYELDRVAREHIASAGYGQYFFHRTGHALGPGDSVHGLGANLDDLETHDTRPILPGRGFTIEPGIYLPDFGVRSEINVYMTETGPTVTSPVQTTPVTVDG